MINTLAANFGRLAGVLAGVPDPEIVLPAEEAVCPARAAQGKQEEEQKEEENEPGT